MISQPFDLFFWFLNQILICSFDFSTFWFVLLISQPNFDFSWPIVVLILCFFASDLYIIFMVLDLSWSRREKKSWYSLLPWNLILCFFTWSLYYFCGPWSCAPNYCCSIASDPNIFVVLEDLVLLYYCSIASDPNIFVVLDLVLLYYADRKSVV